MSDFIRKSIQDLDLGIDDYPVTLPPEFTARAAAVNQFSLVVTPVNPRKQNLRAMINQLPKVWGFANSCVGWILGNGRVQFVFRDEDSMNLVLRRGPWSFNEWMVTVHRWYPNITEEDMKIIPFWVQIKGIPLLYLTSAMAAYVGNRLGHVTEVDFNDNANRVEFVRVQIDWNVDMPLRFQRKFQFIVGENSVIKYRFERLRNFCTKCGSLKHDAKECELSFDNNGEPPEEGNDDDLDDGANGDRNDNVNEGTSDANTLQTIDPFGPIPGLQLNQNHNLTPERTSASSLPSAFEDVELTAERIRYLHARFVRNTIQKKESPRLLVEMADSLESPGQNKRKRVTFENLLQQCEAAEDKAVLCHIRKRERVESQSS
ncbi:uncharacterized protein At4g02000-like [Arabidopsis lyrata subsp. lyrata]|uniref:uncharacterized protein At4g02000-like n=1 Tax=Arabidopsis lyrata subsp. lyrata TaxID=81972 RepID=UPI000A29D62A|nr:uncharacterized protein At4g02000-like [Arabidopsis lyrata subsp. lyrata]|eukprot:XP_020889278.1 uncharacterized protein At4g02000-like [Arabidopsis lyrata subsp. lyrata]